MNFGTQIRWNTMIDMIERYLKLFDPIQQVIIEYKLDLELISQDEQELIGFQIKINETSL